MYWVLGILLFVVIGYFVDREIYFYEGVRLGPRVQAWLYDRWSRKYDGYKTESQLHDDEMLAQPLLDSLKDVPEPFVLDFATGTGRLSLALLNRTEFHGRIVALDLSQGMLEQAASKLRPHISRFDLLRHLSLPLPFPDASFDAVCALEVLELFQNADEPLAEFSRVIRPGGVLLTSRGTEASGRKAKVKSAAEYTSMLERHGFENIHITKWWKWFDRILAGKSGNSEPVRKHALQDVLKCSCGEIRWEQKQNSLCCGHCSRELIVTKEEIVLN
ncbi:MAG: methyltransferase domain-containing protein [Anaerolineales bacterium]